MKTRFLLLPIFTLLVSSSLSAQMYRYVNESGQTVYSQFKPEKQTQYSTVAPPPPPPGMTKPGKPVVSEPVEIPETDKDTRENVSNSDDTDNTEKTEEQLQQEAAERERKQKNCDAAKSNLKVLQNTDPNQRIIGEDGREIKFDDKMRQSRIKQAQRMIKASCGK